MSDQDQVPEKLVGALTAGLKILRYLVQFDTPAGVSQIARDLSINPSTCFNLLKTLVHERLVAFDDIKKTYSLGLGVLELTKGVTERDRIVRLIHDRLEEIARTHRIMVTLWQRTGDSRMVLVDRVDSESQIRMHMSVGQRLPLFIAALGRCMAAFSGLSRSEVRREFETLRWENAPSFETYWDQVLFAKAHSFAVDRDNFVKGVTTVSSPILNANGEAIMCISAVGLTPQLTDALLNALSADLTRHTSEITAALSAASPSAGARAPRGSRGRG